MDHFLDNVISVENKFKEDIIENGTTSDRVVKLVERDQHHCKPVFCSLCADTRVIEFQTKLPVQ